MHQVVTNITKVSSTEIRVVESYATPSNKKSDGSVTFDCATVNLTPIDEVDDTPRESINNSLQKAKKKSLFP